jgi:molybdate transport system substrate-binding protein
MTAIKVLSARAPQMALQKLLTGFARATGHLVTADYGTVGAIGERFKAGETADLLILSPSALTALEPLLVAGSRRAIARAGLAVAIRAGAPAPDLSTPEAFRAALLAAATVSYSDPKAGGSAAAYFVTLLERLGIAPAVNAKATLGRNGHHVAELVAGGQAELGISFLSELVAIDGVAIAGPLPPELQNYTVYAGAVPIASAACEEARGLVAWLTRADADASWRAAGLDPAER